MAETAEAAKGMQMDVDEQGEAELDTLEVEGLTVTHRGDAAERF